MKKIKASGLAPLLDQARRAGIYEEAATIDGLSVVLENLPPDAYTAILEQIKDLEDAEYMHEFQIEHVCRALAEIAGQDFRSVDTIEVDAEDEEGKPVVVNVLRHEWVRDNIVRSWGREMIQVVYRKFLDVASLAEQRTREGVSFHLKEETDEEKFRRLLVEALESSTELPEDMRLAILKEHGLLTSTSTEDLEAVNERARTFAEQQEQSEATEEPGPVRAPQQLVDASQQAHRQMETRVPLNQTAIRPPVPLTEESQTQMVNPRAGRPPPEQVAAPQSRASVLAALEEEASHSGIPLTTDPAVQYHVLPGSEHRGILERPLDQVSDQVMVDGPPMAGINPRFVDPHKARLPQRRR